MSLGSEELSQIGVAKEFILEKKCKRIGNKHTGLTGIPYGILKEFRCENPKLLLVMCIYVLNQSYYNKNRRVQMKCDINFLKNIK